MESEKLWEVLEKQLFIAHISSPGTALIDEYTFDFCLLCLFCMKPFQELIGMM